MPPEQSRVLENLHVREIITPAKEFSRDAPYICHIYLHKGRTRSCCDLRICELRSDGECCTENPHQAKTCVLCQPLNASIDVGDKLTSMILTDKDSLCDWKTKVLVLQLPSPFSSQSGCFILCFLRLRAILVFLSRGPRYIFCYKPKCLRAYLGLRTPP